MTASLTLGQRAIFALAAAYRGRLNGLYMAAFFVAARPARRWAAGRMPMAAGR